MTCFKYRADEDPVVGSDEQRLLTGSWSDRRIGRPEPSMTGLSFSRGGYSRYGLGVPRASGGYTVWRPDHWVFEGTDLRYGDALGLSDAIVGAGQLAQAHRARHACDARRAAHGDLQPRPGTDRSGR